MHSLITTSLILNTELPSYRPLGVIKAVPALTVPAHLLGLLYAACHPQPGATSTWPSVPRSPWPCPPGLTPCPVPIPMEVPSAWGWGCHGWGCGGAWAARPPSHLLVSREPEPLHLGCLISSYSHVETAHATETYNGGKLQFKLLHCPVWDLLFLKQKIKII